jgi:hypothetical protein
MSDVLSVAGGPALLSGLLLCFTWKKNHEVVARFCPFLVLGCAVGIGLHLCQRDMVGATVSAVNLLIAHGFDGWNHAKALREV